MDQSQARGVVRVLGGMSGTSTDGVDVSALTFNEGQGFVFEGTVSRELPSDLKDRLLRLQDPGHSYSGADPIRELALARMQLSELYASTANDLLARLAWPASEVSAFGVHGQTLRHEPQSGFTLQIVDAALISTRLGMAVVSDFRSADVALGGNGAPLVPPFHRAWLMAKDQLSRGSYTAVLNLGGFSNLTLIDPSGEICGGGDCGPANCYLDAIVRLNYGKPYDEQGIMAASGVCNQQLLSELMDNPYYLRVWPASTGREDFSQSWLDGISQNYSNLPVVDLLATLTEMSALSVVRCLSNIQQGGRLYVCGGGSYNDFLLRRIAVLLGPVWNIFPFDSTGLPAQAVESAAFAWLAYMYLKGIPANCPVVTGAQSLAILGQLTPVLQSL